VFRPQHLSIRFGTIDVEMALLATLVAGISLAVFSLAADPGAITGQIHDVTGAAVPGAGISLRSGRTGETIQVKTDNAGSYDLRGLESDDYTMKITSPGFTSITVKSIILSNGELKVIPPLELSISPIACGGGPVLDYLRFLPLGGLDGNLGGSVRVDLGSTVGNTPPIVGAQVSLLCTRGGICGTTRTDSSGRFIFMNISPRSYALRFSHPGYYNAEVSGYQVKGGREIVYDPVYLERCPQGNCVRKQRPNKPLALCE
jgi:hypothetical protein